MFRDDKCRSGRFGDVRNKALKYSLEGHFFSYEILVDTDNQPKLG